MKIRTIIYTAAFLCISNFLAGQNKNQDTVKIEEVVINSNRIPVKLKNIPGAVSLVNSEILNSMPKSIGAEEALRLVPGVNINNQHNGERVHISIRGQGILTERGLRGVGVLLDGIPINDPSGFAPDLYDVDWANVKQIEVLRGPSAGLYGSSGSAGIINITSNNGGNKPFGGVLSQTFGSAGFSKTLLQFDGTKEITNYRVSLSRASGNGYRDHQAFRSGKFYEKINFNLSEKLSITQIISHIDYFHQNPEGLSSEQLNNPKQANPDACPFNEYQKTNRTTLGFTGKYEFNKIHNIQVYSYYKTWDYKETSNKCAEYRNINNIGSGIQYNLNFNTGKINHFFSTGYDYKQQNIKMYKLLSLSDLQRVESVDETNLEADSLLANQIIAQSSIGVFTFYKMSIGNLNFIANVRYDNIKNGLTDKMMYGDTADTDMDFSKTSFKAGTSFNFSDALTVFADFSQGFMPPSTEELAANPLGYSGFNTHLVSASSNCYEIGMRGNLNKKIYYDIVGFRMDTENDFFRFKQSGRGNQEVFYGNAGNSKRYGTEIYFSADITNTLNFSASYTYSDFKYISSDIDPVYTDTNYVLTSPPAAGQYLPNSPEHQLYTEITYDLNRHFKFSLASQYWSKWAIYTDAKAYSGELNPEIYQNWQSGFTLFNARITYKLKIKSFKGEINLSARNFTGESYMAFTEPDPDGNSYQPAPKQEFFVNLKFDF